MRVEELRQVEVLTRLKCVISKVMYAANQKEVGYWHAS